VAARTSYGGRDGEPGAPDFQCLVDQYYGPLYRFALSLTHSEAHASDLVQETFLTWARRGHQLKDAAKVKSWLFTTLHRGFLEKQRRLVRFPHLELDEVELPGVEPELINRISAREVVELLGRVDSQYQAAVALFYLEEYSYKEIANILEIPLGTVKSRLARGILQLKELVLRHAAVSTRPREETL
jgi:RNA polymerase sigma-70 factor (ECF subfamily)